MSSFLPVTPEQIEKAEFPLRMRGYDKDEVDAFLQMIAADMRALQAGTPSPSATAANPYDALGVEVAKVLDEAAASAKSLQERAEGKAAGVRRHAHEEATKVMRDAKAKAQQMVEEAERRVQRLKRAEIDLRQRLYVTETMLESIRHDLDVNDQGSTESEVAATPGPFDAEVTRLRDAGRQPPTHPHDPKPNTGGA